MNRLPIPAGVSLPNAQRRNLPGYGTGTILADNVDTANSRRLRVSCNAGATPHNKGAWSQIVAATSAPIGLVVVSVDVGSSAAATDTSALLDIGIGGAGSEVVKIPNLAVGWIVSGSTVPHAAHYAVPVYIPQGSRVAARCQAAEVSKVISFQVAFFTLAEGRIPPSSLVAMGANAATSRGVDLAVPASNNTKGAWTEIIAATAQPFAALAVGVQGGGDTTLATCFGLLDVGYGASGSERILGPDLPLSLSSSEAIGWHFIPPPLIPCRLPAGTRLAARWAVSDITSSLDVILYGIPE